MDARVSSRRVPRGAGRGVLFHGAQRTDQFNPPRARSFRSVQRRRRRRAWSDRTRTLGATPAGEIAPAATFGRAAASATRQPGLPGQDLGTAATFGRAAASPATTPSGTAGEQALETISGCEPRHAAPDAQGPDYARLPPLGGQRTTSAPEAHRRAPCTLGGESKPARCPAPWRASRPTWRQARRQAPRSARRFTRGQRAPAPRRVGAAVRRSADGVG